MALYRGGSEPSAIYRGTVPVQKVMRGTVEVWSAGFPYTPWSTGGTVATASITGYTVRATTVIPHDMVADIVWNSSGLSGTTIGAVELNGEYLTGRTDPDPLVQGRFYLPAGSTVEFGQNASYNNMSGTWSITAVDAMPDLSHNPLIHSVAYPQSTDVVVASWAYPLACTVANVTFKADWQYTSSSSTRVLKLAKGTPSSILATSGDEADTLSVNNLSLAAGERIFFIIRSEASNAAYRQLQAMTGEGWSITLA